MAVRDRLRKNAARYVAPGEQIQAVFYAMRSAMECSDRAVVATGRRPAEAATSGVISDRCFCADRGGQDGVRYRDGQGWSPLVSAGIAGDGLEGKFPEPVLAPLPEPGGSGRSAAAQARRHMNRFAGFAAGAAVTAAALAACSSASKPASTSGARSGTIQLAPRQALLEAATKARQLTSATETLSIQAVGATGATTSGTLVIQLKPALLVNATLNVTAAATNTRIKMIITGKAVYFSEAALTSQVGKPWVKIDLPDLSALVGPSGAGLARLFQSLQSNNLASQAQMFAVAKNTRVAGELTIDGVPTTEYAGSFTASDALKALPASLRKALASGLQALGNSTVDFREWIDGQHYLRKVTEIETVNGDSVTTTVNLTAINQPVSITLPPASQTSSLGGSAVSGQPSNGDLAAKMVAAPPGFALSQDPGEHSGPTNAAGFNSYMGGQGNLAATLHFHRGYTVFYDNPDGDIIEVILFQFATQNDAAFFKAGWSPGEPVNSKADPAIPGAEEYDSTTVDQDAADHGVIATKGNTAFIIDDVTSTTAPVPLVEAMARQQYAAL